MVDILSYRAQLADVNSSDNELFGHICSMGLNFLKTMEDFLQLTQESQANFFEERLGAKNAASRNMLPSNQ